MHELAHDFVGPRLHFGIVAFVVDEIVVARGDRRKFVNDRMLRPPGATLYPKLSYDIVKDFALITNLAKIPGILVVPSGARPE